VARRLASAQSTTATERANPRSLDTWVGKREVAEALGISQRSVERLISTRELPPPVKFGRLVRWRRSTIMEFLAAREAAAQRTV
jgi:excisionase family DNA binding protein